MRKIKRPLLCGCLIVIAVIVLRQNMVDPPPWESRLSEQLHSAQDLAGVTVIGQVYEKEVRTLYGQEVLFLYLKSVTVSPDTESRDGESYPDISEQIIEEKLICQLEANQPASFGVSAGSQSGREDMASALERQICLGSRVAVQGRLELFAHATNPGEWDSVDYYLISGVAGQLKQVRLLGSDGGRWLVREWLHRCRLWLKERLYRALPEKEASILSRMLLGEKHGLDREVKELYQNNGIAHVLAISGLHITLLGMGFYRLLRRCGCPIVPAAIAGGCMILLYGCMVGWGISAVRAIGMYLLRMLGEIWGKHYDMLTAMGVLAAGMVCHNPRLAYHCGFLLSFGAVAGMGMIYPALEKMPVCERLETVIRRRRMGGNSGGSVTGGLLFLRGLLRSVTASLSITLATLPIQLYFFYQLPVYGTLLNLVVLPLMGLLLTGGLALMALPVAAPLRWSVRGILALYEGVCHMAERLPGHLWIAGRPDWWQIAVYYGLLTAAVILLGRCARVRAQNQIGSGRACGRARSDCDEAGRHTGSGNMEVGWIFSLLSCWGIRVSLLILTVAVIILTRRWDSGLRMTMLDVGQGDCICVRTSQGQVYLFDGGSSSRSRVGEYVLIPYLKYQGIRSVDGIFISHADQDHVNAIRELLADSEGIRLKVLYLPRLGQAAAEQLEELTSLAHEAECRVEYLAQGMGWQQGELRLTCLWPRAGYAGESNAASACYLLEDGEFTALLTGDVEDEGERGLTACLESSSVRDLDVLKVAHHGSRYSTTDAFLQSAAPKLALISAGRDNSYGHPHRELLQRLEENGCTVVQTPQSGAVTIQVGGKAGANRWRIWTYLKSGYLKFPFGV